MTRALAIALCLLACGRAEAQFGYDGMQPTPGGKRPVFKFTAPAAGDYATLTAATGQTGTCARTGTATIPTSISSYVAATANHCRVGYLGLAAEASRSNGLLWSDDISNAAWSKQHAPTILADQCVGQGGTSTMDKMTGADSVSLVYQAVASPGTVGPFMVSEVFASTSTTPSLTLEAAGGGATWASCTCTIDPPLMCLATAAGADCQAVATTAIGSTPVRMTLAGVNAVSTMTVVDFMVAPGIYNTANNTGAFACVGGAQNSVGLGYFGTYIPTVAASASHTVDINDFGSLALSSTPSFSATVVVLALPPSGTAVALDATDGTHIWKLGIDTAGHAVCSYDANSDTSASTITINLASSVSCSYDGAKVAACVDGICHQTAAIFSPVVSFTHLYLGSDGAANPLNGFISTACAAKSSHLCSSSAATGSVPSSGLVYWFDANNIDGSNNGTLANNALISTWVNLGSGEAGTGNTAPVLQKAIVNSHAAVNFAGDTQAIDLGVTSPATSAFIHSTGVFDAFLVFEAVRNSNPLLQNSAQGASQTGEQIYTDASGHALFRLNSNGSAVFTQTSAWTMPLFAWRMVEVNGDGSIAGISPDAVNFDYQQLPGSLPVGNATQDLFFGGTYTGALNWNGDIEEVLVFNRKLSASERANVRAWLRARSAL